MISNNEGWTYLNRGNGREGLVRHWERDCWGILTKKGRDYKYLIHVLNAYFDKAKAELIPAGATTVLIDMNNLEDPKGGIAQINDLLNQHAILETFRIKQKVEGSKIVLTKHHGKQLARVTSIPHRTFSTNEWEALKKFCNGRKPSDIAYRVNTEFFPPDTEMRFMSKSEYAVVLDTKQPEAMVVQIQEILEKTNAPYEVSLKLEDIEVPMVSMAPQENTEVA